MKPGFFRLPRMYQIDPAWTIYYPGSAGRNIHPKYPGNNFLPNYTSMRRIKKMREEPESIAIFPDGCEIVEPNGGGNAIFGQRSRRIPQLDGIREPKTQTELLLENLGGTTEGLEKLPSRPKWSDTLPTDEELLNYGKPVTLVRPRGEET
uniref:Uncharacterized protein n=1 Tax=Panagrolaimus sp. JU765 TaxID=591449 RepID=A0AC34R0Z0_9BILA